MRRKCDIGIADWDRQGNLLNDGTLSYVYDGFSRVAEVETAEGGTQKNRYDAEGLRYEMEENGQLVQFLYADREVIAETQSDGNVIRYIRGLGLISSDSEKAKTYYHYVCWSQARLAIFRPVELTNFRTYKNSQCTFSFRFTYYLMVIIHQLLLLQFHICFHDSCFL